MGTTADKLNKVLQTKEAIRTAINNKGGTLTETDTFASYATAIENIQSGSANEPITITQNGTYTAPDGVGYSPVNVNVPSKEEETKSITITENGKTTVLPTSGKVLSKVDIMANVQSGGGGDNPLQYVIDNQGGDGKPSCNYLFAYYKGSSLDNAINKLDTSKVTAMSYMFYYCEKLTIISQLDTSSCTYTASMFENCLSLTSIPQLDTSKVTNVISMFEKCEKLTTIPQLDTSKVVRMDRMFTDCLHLTTIPLLDTSSCTDMGYMFENCQRLTKIDITHMNIFASYKLTSFASYNCSLKKLIIRNMDTLPTLSSNAFKNCYHFYGTTNEIYNPEGLKDGRIYVPDDKVEALKTATNWSVFADIIVPLSTLVEE